MSIVVEAVYENGVLKPLKKLNLREGERVKITITREGDIEDLFGILKTSKTPIKDKEAFYEYVSERTSLSR